MAVPFMTGRNDRLVFVKGSKKLELKNVGWKVDQIAEEIADDVNGERRSRKQKVIDGWKITLTALLEDLKEVEALMEYDEVIDQRVAPEEVGVGILFYPNNGTKKAAEARNVTIDAWGLGNDGRKDRTKLSVPMRADDFVMVPTV